MGKIHFIVTAGGTREPIDSVRYIGNRSSGRLGAAIASEAAARGHEVCLVRARDSVHVLGKVSDEVDRRIRCTEFETAQDLKEILQKEVPNLPDPGAVVMAAAVADYSPVPLDGKISSKRDELVLRLLKVDKIVDRVKTWNGAALLVKFKLESGSDREQLLSIGAESARQSRADLMLLNDITEIAGARHRAILYRPDRATSIDLEGKVAIAGAIIAAVEEIFAERRSS